MERYSGVACAWAVSEAQRSQGHATLVCAAVASTHIGWSGAGGGLTPSKDLEGHDPINQLMRPISSGRPDGAAGGHIVAVIAAFCGRLSASLSWLIISARQVFKFL
jgi:hypothetical protein